jgi:alkylation response protein AidB-like acyl-CoA dehydrogenase
MKRRADFVEFRWDEQDEKFRAELGAFIDQELALAELLPGAGPGGAGHVALARTFAQKLAARAWLTPSWPTEYGGGGATAWQHIAMSEELWQRGEPRGPQYMNVNWIGPAIMRFGTPKQKTYHLGRISKGDVFWCQGFSEPDAGTDLASLRTRAVRHGDEYVINGQKIWTSYANEAEFCFLLVRTDPNADQHAGISILLVPMNQPGIEVRDIPAIVGEHIFHEVFFEDVHVPVSCLLGSENEGWPIIRAVLAHERVGAPKYARAAFVLDRIAGLALEKGLAENADIKRKLGEARAACEAARLLCYVAIDERAKDKPPSVVAYPARAAMVQADRLVADVAMEILGPDALSAGLADDQFHTAFTAGVATGTYEVQLELISRLALRLPRSA